MESLPSTYTGDCCVDETDVMGQKAKCLTHFS